MDEIDNQRDFKGVWIPREIWLDTELTMLEKGILTEVDSLDNDETGCYASNAYLAKFCQCSETKVSIAISKLISLGYLYIQSFDGRTRVLKSRLSKSERQNFKNCEADTQKVKVNNIKNNTSNNTNNNTIDDFFESVWQLYPKKTNKSQIKKAAKERLYKVGYDKLARCIERYKEELEFNHTDYQYIKAGSTFFNGGYEDYLADDWTLPTRQPHSTTNAKNAAPTDFANLSAVDKGARILQRLKEEMGE